MTDDEIGLSFFTEGDTSAPAGQPSVFGAVDQAEMIARIDAVTDDDLGSTFFGDSLQEVEVAATRAFDIGVRTLSEGPRSSDAAATAFSPGSAMAEPFAAPSGGATPVAAAPVTVVGPLAQDAVARRAFILGGPAAVRPGP